MEKEVDEIYGRLYEFLHGLEGDFNAEVFAEAWNRIAEKEGWTDRLRAEDHLDSSGVPTKEKSPITDPPEGKECIHDWHLHYPNMMYEGTKREHWEQEKRTCLKCGREEVKIGNTWYNQEEYRARKKESEPPEEPDKE